MPFNYYGSPSDSAEARDNDRFVDEEDAAYGRRRPEPSGLPVTLAEIKAAYRDFPHYQEEGTTKASETC